jgi:hypothetical protein
MFRMDGWVGHRKPLTVGSNRMYAYLKNQLVSRKARGMPCRPPLAATKNSTAKTRSTSPAPSSVGRPRWRRRLGWGEIIRWKYGGPSEVTK